MSDNVEKFPGAFFGTIPSETILSAAIEADLPGVIVIGYDKDGNLYWAHSMPEPEKVIWLLRATERQIFEACDL